MLLSGTVAQAASADVMGFDFNADGQKLTDKLARAFHDFGYRFCIRYVPREAEAKTVAFDLKRDEAERILDAGFALFVVQHFETEKGWTPSADKGGRYGRFAGQWCQEIVGLPPGVCVFLDLEAVKKGVPQEDVVAYCHEWHKEVRSAGYEPGVYLGTHARIPDKEVLSLLPFRHHWAAYNEDFEVPGKGIQLKQILVPAESEHRPPGVGGFDFQADRTLLDQDGNGVRWLVRP